METLTKAEREFLTCTDAEDENSLAETFSYFERKPVTRAGLLQHAVNVSRYLPDGSYALNLCRDRYVFIVTFLAVILKQQRNLLPPNQASQTLVQLLENYPRSYCISDQPGVGGDHTVLLGARHFDGDGGEFEQVPDSRTVAVSFTSGSTGQPKVIAKTWGEFRHAARLALRQLHLADVAWRVVSTVPPQHIYGLETSLFWPMGSSLSIDNRQPFFPEDVRRALLSPPQSTSKDWQLPVERPCLLVTTPAHLKACIAANLQWQNVAMILSSTGPLAPDLAAAAERSFNAPVFEIFGSTETQSYASRRLTQSMQWTPYAGMRISEQSGGVFRISGGHLPQGVNLDDRFEVASDGCFIVTGRSAEIVKVAGKRTSLAELNNLLNGIDGVVDGAFFQGTDERLGALVVSDLSKEEIFAVLKTSLDPVFLPRSLYRVERLPRNELGKIDHEQLLDLIDVCKRHRNV